MKPAPFEYHRPTSLEEAAALLDEHEGAEAMAGNQSLGIMMSNRLARPDHLVDLNAVESLSFIEFNDRAVSLGALARHREIERSAALREAIPMFPMAAEQIAGPTVRNRGTLGGSLAEADPAGNYPTVAVTLDATLHLVSAEGERSIAAEEFFVGYLFTALEEGELIERVTVDRAPYPTERTGMAFEELKPAAQTWPTVSAAAAVRVDDPTADEPSVEHARLGLANAADVPIRVPEAEAAVEGGAPDEGVLEAVGAAVVDAAEPADELHADAEFKLDAAAEYARRALTTAYERATGD
ncbi:MAG: xanthine dehydrogenase family protein subunit M [Halobacteriales archaeon]|nr:xanthine dehydrogenase family protein subunit M [Halobacteriales archaeon]